MADYLIEYRDIAKRIMKEARQKTVVCWEFVHAVRQHHGLSSPLQDWEIKDGSNMQAAAEYCSDWKITEPIEWCISLYRCSKFDWHSGLVLPGCKQFIHLMRGTGLQVARLDDRYWSKVWQNYYDKR